MTSFEVCASVHLEAMNLFHDNILVYVAQLLLSQPDRCCLVKPLASQSRDELNKQFDHFTNEHEQCQQYGIPVYTTDQINSLLNDENSTFGIAGRNKGFKLWVSFSSQSMQFASSYQASNFDCVNTRIEDSSHLAPHLMLASSETVKLTFALQSPGDIVLVPSATDDTSAHAVYTSASPGKMQHVSTAWNHSNLKSHGNAVIHNLFIRQLLMSLPHQGWNLKELELQLTRFDFENVSESKPTDLSNWMALNKLKNLPRASKDLLLKFQDQIKEWDRREVWLPDMFSVGNVLQQMHDHVVSLRDSARLQHSLCTLEMTAQQLDHYDSEQALLYRSALRRIMMVAGGLLDSAQQTCDKFPQTCAICTGASADVDWTTEFTRLRVLSAPKDPKLDQNLTQHIADSWQQGAVQQWTEMQNKSDDTLETVLHSRTNVDSENEIGLKLGKLRDSAQTQQLYVSDISITNSEEKTLKLVQGIFSNAIGLLHDMHCSAPGISAPSHYLTVNLLDKNFTVTTDAHNESWKLPACHYMSLDKICTMPDQCKVCKMTFWSPELISAVSSAKNTSMSKK